MAKPQPKPQPKAWRDKLPVYVPKGKKFYESALKGVRQVLKDTLDDDTDDALSVRRKSAAYAFGEKLAESLVESLRLPHDYQAARQLGIAGAIGAGIGAVRGFTDPGYNEVYDSAGHVIAKKKRNAYLAALKNGLIGGAVGVGGNYAAQTAHNYTPEIDALVGKLQQLTQRNTAPHA